MIFFELELPLPFLLPIEDGVSLVNFYTGQGTFCVKFNKAEIKFKSHENYRTVTNLEIKFDPIDISKFPENTNSDLTQFLFMLSLNHINVLLNVFSSSIQYSGIYTISVVDLPPAVIIRYRGTGIAYITNPYEIIDHESKPLTIDELKPILNKWAIWTKYPDLALPDKILEDAKQNIIKDRNTVAIIGLQTSMEIFLSNTIRIILLKEGKSEIEIEKILNIPFRNLIEQHLSKMLKINLKFNDPQNTIVYSWYNNLYLLRNRIVHYGLSNIFRIEAIEALKSYGDLRNLIGETMVAQGYLDSYGSFNIGIFNRDFETEEMRKKFEISLERLGINITKK